MIQRLSTNKIMWVLAALMSLIAASVGVANPGIYEGLVRPDMLPGTVSQDLVTIALSIMVLFWTVRMKEKDMTRQILILGILGSLFYGYGIWVIERMYNSLYFIYLAIFAVSFYSIVFFVANIRREIVERIKVNKIVRSLTSGWSLINPLIFYPLWMSQLLPLMQAREKIEHTYAVYILDLTFVMPALLIIGIMVAKNRGLGLLLAPALFVHGFTLLFSVGLGGIIAPFFHQTGDMAEVYFYMILSFVFLILTVFHLRSLRTPGETDRKNAAAQF